MNGNPSVGDMVAAELKASIGGYLARLGDEVRADGAVSVLIEISRAAAATGNTAALAEVREILPWIGQYHETAAARAAIDAAWSMASLAVGLVTRLAGGGAAR